MGVAKTSKPKVLVVVQLLTVSATESEHDLEVAVLLVNVLVYDEPLVPPIVAVPGVKPTGTDVSVHKIEEDALVAELIVKL